MQIKTTVGAVLAAAGVASAQPAIVSFTYSDLSASFDAGTASYEAIATSSTSGDVSRLDWAPGTAEFDTGSLPGAFADANISMSITNIGAFTADGDGTVTLTDSTGDQLVADIDGVFRAIGGSVFFEGLLSNAFFIDNTNDGQFDGTTAGSFINPHAGPYTGSLVELYFNPGNFFGSSFSDQTTLASGLLVPSPGAIAVLSLGGLIAARRRR